MYWLVVICYASEYDDASVALNCKDVSLDTKQSNTRFLSDSIEGVRIDVAGRIQQSKDV